MLLRRHWLVLSLVAAALALGSLPQAGRAEHAGRATQIKLLVPFGADGQLNANLRVRGRESFPPPFACQAGSIRTTRPDAWRCGTADPCFAPPMLLPDPQGATLACMVDPWSGEVTLLTLQTPLRTAEECEALPRCREPLDLTQAPWALELANGARCNKFIGTIDIIAGDIRMAYFCSDPGGSAGGLGIAVVDRSTPVWQVFFLADGSEVLEQVDVLVAWY